MARHAAYLVERLRSRLDLPELIIACRRFPTYLRGQRCADELDGTQITGEASFGIHKIWQVWSESTTTVFAESKAKQKAVGAIW